jgi:hypothetical protein
VVVVTRPRFLYLAYSVVTPLRTVYRQERVAGTMTVAQAVDDAQHAAHVLGGTIRVRASGVRDVALLTFPSGDLDVPLWPNRRTVPGWPLGDGGGDGDG